MKNLSFDSFNVVSVAAVLIVPGLAIGAFGGLSLGLTAVTLLTAVAVLAASAMLDISLYRIDGMPRLAALLLVTFVAVLPEVTSDSYHAWMGTSPLTPDYSALSLSAITGSSFLLLGVGLPLLYLVHRLRTGDTRLELHSSQGIELLLFLMVIFYGFVIYVKEYIWPLDSPVLLILFGILAWKGFRRYRANQVRLRPFQRSLEAVEGSNNAPSRLMYLQILYGAVAVYLAVPAFADGMHALGLTWGPRGFSLMQDIVPILTKVPLLAVMAAMVWNGRTGLATSMLVLTVVALWTVGLGALPFASLIGGALHGSPEVLTLGDNQKLEVLVAISQALLAVTLLSKLSVTWRGAAVLVVLFVVHRMLMYLYPQAGHALASGLMAGIYLGLSAAIVAWDRSRIRFLVGGVVGQGRRSGALSADGPVAADVSGVRHN